ncbi:antibiotic biosynthesis monooxygenase family protein [Oceanobacillus saliphilus]|uniref:antibiotic biosynthesis monooxygenase family protein n=1 Tax=Oceanobacillus saliphilus TaxID=2925834 RepID=UPI00201E58D9|nr:antibiotic biosynthesis monooxygenase [Oceanobacillus saliphilus]
MKAYMTSGTIDFLKKIDNENPELNLYLMTNSEGGMAYYENNEKKIFSAGRVFEVVMKTGEILEEGYVVMNNIPVSDESKPGFEHRFKNQNNIVESMPGFKAFRLLRPLQGNTYVVFTQWGSSADFENWKDSDQFKEAHKSQAVKQPAYTNDRPFLTKCTMYIEEEEE